jgi:Zn finger protein HypA/HybF involved in hydrogenase expression
MDLTVYAERIADVGLMISRRVTCLWTASLHINISVMRTSRMTAKCGKIVLVNVIGGTNEQRNKDTYKLEEAIIKRIYDYACLKCFHTWRSKKQYLKCPKCGHDKLDVKDDILLADE